MNARLESARGISPPEQVPRQRRLRIGPEPLVVAASGLILVYLAAVRIYCAYYTIPIRTWDDALYRRDAETTAGNIPPNHMWAYFVFPKENTLDGMRTTGYNTWLAAAVRVSSSPTVTAWLGKVDNERVWQSVNLVFLLAQGLLIGFFFYWATARVGLGLAGAALYLLAPIIFGINRWVMTENHAYTALCALGFGSVAYLSLPPKPALSGARVAALSAIAIALAVFSTAREYIFPSYVVACVLFIVVFCAERRWAELALLVVPVLPYWVGVATYMPESLAHYQAASSVHEYFHPMDEWLWHAFVYCVGPGLGLLIPYLAVEVCGVLRAERTRRHGWPGKRTLAIALVYLVLGAVYLAAMVKNQHRTMRPSAVIFITLLTGVLAAVGALRDSSFFPWRRVQLVVFALLAVGTIHWTKQLFFDFDGGRTYFHSATGMEYYNHPARLWRLSWPDDMHTHLPDPVSNPFPGSGP